MIFQMLFLKICTFTFSIIMKKIGTWNLIIKIGATNSRMSSITKGRLRIQMTFIIWRTSWWVGQYIPREEEPNVYLCETKNVKGLEWTKTEMENAKMLPLWPLWSHCFRKDITRGTLSECCVQGDMKKDSCHGKGKNSYNTNKQIKKKKSTKMWHIAFGKQILRIRVYRPVLLHGGTQRLRSKIYSKGQCNKLFISKLFSV